MDSKKYIGMDVHQATISVAVRDSAGKVVMESILETKASTILEFIRGLGGNLWVTFVIWKARSMDSDSMISARMSSSFPPRCKPRKQPLRAP